MVFLSVFLYVPVQAFVGCFFSFSFAKNYFLKARSMSASPMNDAGRGFFSPLKVQGNGGENLGSLMFKKSAGMSWINFSRTHSVIKLLIENASRM